MYDELVNQNEIPIKMTAIKEHLNNLEANFDRKIDKMLNVLLKQWQNIIAKLLLQLKSVTDLTVMMQQ